MCIYIPIFTDIYRCIGRQAQTSGGLDGWSAVFFVSFMVFVSWTLLQVREHINKRRRIYIYIYIHMYIYIYIPMNMYRYQPKCRYMCTDMFS